MMILADRNVKGFLCLLGDPRLRSLRNGLMRVYVETDRADTLDSRLQKYFSVKGAGMESRLLTLTPMYHIEMATCRSDTTYSYIAIHRGKLEPKWN
jgi:hypothetical protein